MNMKKSIFAVVAAAMIAGLAGQQAVSASLDLGGLIGMGQNTYNSAISPSQGTADSTGNYMASVPGARPDSGGFSSVGSGGWVVGEWMPSLSGAYARVVAQGTNTILQLGTITSVPAGTCTAVNTNTLVYSNGGNNWGPYCSGGTPPSYTYDMSGNSGVTAYCPVVTGYQWSGTTDSCSVYQVGQTRPASTSLSINVAQWDVTNSTGVSWKRGIITPVGFIMTSSHTEYITPWDLSGNPYPN